VAAMISLIPRMDRLCVACDDESNLRMISAEAEALGVTIGVLIDMNIGMNRCGIHWSKKDEIIAMSHLAEKLPGIEYRGLMGYEGHAQGANKKDELCVIPNHTRADNSADASFLTLYRSSQLVADRLGSAKKWVEDSGLKVPLVSGSGSGNYFVSKDLGTTNEIQAGGGVLHCMQYATSMNGHDKEPDHRNSIQLACQIISLAGFDEGRAIGDAGFKTMFPSGVLPWVALVAFHVLRAQAAMYDSCHRTHTSRLASHVSRNSPRVSRLASHVSRCCRRRHAHCALASRPPGQVPLRRAYDFRIRHRVATYPRPGRPRAHDPAV
jgi:D-serine deaminase-like pyridoxal phosphate-dependent protein